MSSWIERELEMERQEANQQRRHKQAVRDFWPRIVDRIRADVDYFNRHCPPERVVELIEPSDFAVSLAGPGTGERSITLWLESHDGRVRLRRGSVGEAETLDLRLEVNGAIEYDHLIGDEATLKLSHDLLKPVMFPGR